MKTFPMASPPSSAGIYAIRNTKTKEVYIGKSVHLRRRYAEWKAVFSTGLGAKNPAIAAAVGTPIEDWEFVVVFETTSADASELDRLERKAISRASQTPGVQVLNGMFVPQPRAASHPAPASVGIGSTPKSVVVDQAGRPMTYNEVAAVLGVSHQAVKKRLRRLRGKGTSKITISDLGGPQKIWDPKNPM